MTEDQQPDPKTAQIANEEPAGPGRDVPLDADEHEPDVEPFAGDDDILSGHLEPGS